MSKLIEQVQSSDLSRNPLKVFTAAEKAPVTVTRRDGQDLVLMNKRETENRVEFMTHVSRVMSALTDSSGLLVDRMARQFPWMLALEEPWRTECSEQLLETTLAAVANDVPSLALNALSSWNETAYATAMGWGSQPIDRLEKPILVERPA